MGRLLLGVSGGIAAYKALELVRLATAEGHAVRAIQTPASQRFVGPACVIDVEREVAADADFLLTPARIEQWEAEHGRIPDGAWVLKR